MSKSVLISIQPYWFFLIIAESMGRYIGKVKTEEIRKNFPKDSDWDSTAIIYCSKDKKSFNRIPKKYQPLMEKFLGKVGGEFVCNKITPLFNVATTSWDLLAGNIHEYAKRACKNACLTEEEIHAYANGKNCYAWSIRNLEIYNKPKELSEFTPVCKFGKDLCKMCCFYEETFGGCCRVFTRPPQSWCYVEEL